MQELIVTMTIKELFEASEAAMVIAETEDMSDMCRLTSALRAQTLMLQAQTMQALLLSSGKSLLERLRDALQEASPYHYSDRNPYKLSYHKLIEAPYGALIVTNRVWNDEKKEYDYPDPRVFFQAITPYVQAGWDIQMVRHGIYDEQYSMRRQCEKQHNMLGSYVVMLGRPFCERCCRPYDESPTPEPSHSATEG